MVDTNQCIYFVIFILILQQIDGNIIEPKILGDSTGLASFWVLFAVLVGGGLFGFIGMIVGIPVFAVMYTYLSRLINGRLKRRGFSTDLSDYKVDSYRVKKKKILKEKAYLEKAVERVNKIEIKKILDDRAGNWTVFEDVSMDKYTSFRAGGSADIFIEPDDIQALKDVLFDIERA